MSEWKKCKLGDLISIKGGFSYKGEYIGTGDKFLLGMGCVSYSKTFLQSGARPYSGDCSDRFYAKPFDIVLATRQQSDNLPILGLPAIIPQSFWGEKVIVGTNLYKVDNYSEVDNKYLYWLMRSPNYINYIHSCSKGSTVKMITKDAVESFAFMCPPKEERDFISGLLWQIEDKIDLLNRQNQTLESMAESLFRHYFIDNAKPEWVEGKLMDLITVKYGKDHKKVLDGKIPIYGSGGIMRYGNQSLYEKESVLIPRKGSLGNIIYINSPFWSVDTMFYTEMRRPNIAKYIYHFVKNQDIASMNVGSAVPSMTSDILNNMPIDIPPDYMLLKFEGETSNWYNKISSNNKQINILTELRDTLLPKLMNNEINIE